MQSRDPDEHSRMLAAKAVSDGDPTGWFEQLYVDAAAGVTGVPWDREYPGALLAKWVQANAPTGDGRRALVVGAGLGRDAEFLARLGYDTVAFDISATAVAATRSRYPDSPVQYVTADLLDPPVQWRRGFDLVAESLTIQSLPAAVRAPALANLAPLVAPGGTLVVVSVAAGDDEHEGGPPWPLHRSEIDAFATDGVETVRVDDVTMPDAPGVHWWVAELRRPAGVS
ncbi:MAG: methyltransferase domain-containing protein [Streptosporangiales bacterium]|nr:methyltransferase domain-containing protein [Streptosporangiales bacterium]